MAEAGSGPPDTTRCLTSVTLVELWNRAKMWKTYRLYNLPYMLQVSSDVRVVLSSMFLASSQCTVNGFDGFKASTNREYGLPY